MYKGMSRAAAGPDVASFSKAVTVSSPFLLPEPDIRRTEHPPRASSASRKFVKVVKDWCGERE